MFSEQLTDVLAASSKINLAGLWVKSNPHFLTLKSNTVSKHTEGKWEVNEHSWSDTSISVGDKTICSMSICEDATEETQEGLESEMTANAKLIAASPDLLTYGHTLAVLAIQSDRYRDDADFKEAVDNMLNITKQLN